ncbi:MAG: hypothetical protein LBT98_03270 [Puniceicoccales bacterium]|nr:hypothetical protein [Puniceicoccales bacterium]
MAKRLRGATCALPMASAMAEASPSTLFYHLLGLGRPASLGWNRPQRPAGRRPERSEGASGAGQALLGALPPASLPPIIDATALRGRGIGKGARQPPLRPPRGAQPHRQPADRVYGS